MLWLIIVLAAGIILIILSYKMKSEIKEDIDKADVKTEDVSNFDNYLNNESVSVKIAKIDENVEELKQRIDEIQQSLLLMSDDVKIDDVPKNESTKTDDIPKNENTKINADSHDEEQGSNKDEKDKAKKNDEIFKMYDNGCSIEEICSILKIGKGEVLLRLGLRK